MTREQFIHKIISKFYFTHTIIRYNNFTGNVRATACCGIRPITNENYCPKCGRKIIKKDI